MTFLSFAKWMKHKSINEKINYIIYEKLIDKKRNINYSRSEWNKS